MNESNTTFTHHFIGSGIIPIEVSKHGDVMNTMDYSLILSIFIKFYQGVRL